MSVFIVYSINSFEKKLVSSIPLSIPPVVDPNYSLIKLLELLRGGKHLALVSKNPEETSECLSSKRTLRGDAKVIGIVTLEDVLEQIIQNQIIDETDYCDDRGNNKRSAKVGMNTQNLRSAITGTYISKKLLPGKITVVKDTKLTSDSTNGVYGTFDFESGSNSVNEKQDNM